MSGKGKAAAVIAAALIAGLLSFFVAADFFTSDRVLAGAGKSLKETRTTVMEMTASAAVASAVVAAVPGDATTPVANKLADLSGYLLVILAAVYLESCLLTLTGFLAFRILIPVACGILILWVFRRRKALLRGAAVLALAGVLLYSVVPVCLFASDHLETFSLSSVKQTVQDAENGTGKIEEHTRAKENKNLLESAKDLIGTSASALKAEGEKVLGSFMDGVAKLIIRTILLPIFMLLVYLGIVRTAFSMLGIRDGAGAGTPSHRVLRRKLKGFKHSGTGVSQ